jgi:hypothetical protein
MNLKQKREIHCLRYIVIFDHWIYKLSHPYQNELHSVMHEKISENRWMFLFSFFFISIYEKYFILKIQHVSNVKKGANSKNTVRH